MNSKRNNKGNNDDQVAAVTETPASAPSSLKAEAATGGGPGKPPVTAVVAGCLPPIPCSANRMMNNLAISCKELVQSRYDELLWLCLQVAGPNQDARPWMDEHMPKHTSIKRTFAIDRFKWQRRWIEVIIKTYPGHSPEIHFVFDDTAIGHTLAERKAAGERADFIAFSRKMERDSRRRGDHLGR